MNIGTGKPTPSELKMLPHFGIDCLDPGIVYSVYQYLTDAAQGLAQAQASGRSVWVCGGTGLYIHALISGLKLGAPPRPELREALARRIETSSARQVAAALGLELVDPDNPVRVMRQAEQACSVEGRLREIYAWAGLEPAAKAGRIDRSAGLLQNSLTAIKQWRCGGILVLDPGRQELLGRIEVRVRGMFTTGLIEEVAELRRRGFGQTAVVAEGIAYREAGQVLDGELDVPAAVERAVIRTRQYAKRQRTYFKGRGWPVVNDAGLSEALIRARQSIPG